MIPLLRSCFILLFSVFFSGVLGPLTTCHALSGPPYTYTEYFRYDDDPVINNKVWTPSDLAFGAGGSFGNDLYVVDPGDPDSPTPQNRGWLWRATDLNSDGDCLDAGEGTVLFRGPGNFERPTGLAFGRNVSNNFDNDLFIIDDGPNRAYRITDNDGLPLTISTFTSGTLFTPSRGVFSNDGNHLFVVDAWVYGSSLDGRIFSVDATGNISTFVTAGTNADLYDCTFAEITSDGWVTTQRNSPGDYSPLSTHLIQFRDNNSDGDADDSGESRILLNNDEGLWVYAFAFDSTDRLFVATNGTTGTDRAIVELVDGNSDGDFQDPGERITIVTMTEFAGGIYSMAFNNDGDLFLGTFLPNGSARTGVVYKITGNGIPLTERAALIALYNSTDGDNWTNKDGWKQTPLEEDGFGPIGTEENWYGISITANRVTEIDLSSNNLNGTIPLGLENLEELTSLDLSNNQLTGSIPYQLGNLANVVSLDLSNNQLTGNIPPELGNLGNPAALNFDNIQPANNISPQTGSSEIPGNLTSLSLSHNQLTGNIPPELGNLINLTQLILDNNQLTGDIPTELGNLINLIYLFLNNNQLTGNIPTEFGNLINLLYLDLSNNQLTGHIPPELGNLINLIKLYLHNNQFVGSIPDTLLTLVNLLDGSGLNLDNNHLYTNNPNVKVFVDLKNGSGWEETQTVSPTVTTAEPPPEFITMYTAQSGGEVTSEGAEPVTTRGVCWSTNPDPTTSDSFTTDGSGLGVFTSNLTGLSNDETYYVRAWAINNLGTAYGNEVTFTTGINPEVTTQKASDVGLNSATGHGNVTNLGTPLPTQHGFCWNTYGTPTVGDNTTEMGPVTATGPFTSNITGLSSGTAYFIRAYATNENGTFYGNEEIFATPSSTTFGACFVNSGQQLGAIWPEYPDDYTYSHGVALGDLDKDDDLDAFVVNAHCNPNAVWLNDGSGNFSLGQVLGLPDPDWPGDYAPSRRVALGDLNGNGHLDAFVANNGGYPNTVWFNNESGAFTDSGQRLGSTNSQGLAIGDLDGDGDLDIFVANADNAPNTVWINEEGSGTFSDSGQRLGTVCSKAVALGDLDGDGDLDAFVGNGADVLNAVYINDGTGTFTKLDQPNFTDYTTAQDVALADLDGDDDLDVVIARGWSEPDQVWLNNGSGIFTNSGQSLGGYTCTQGVAVGDVNNDGSPDIFTAKAGGEPNQFFLNDGKGGFYSAGMTGDGYSQGVALGDLNGDGTIDAFVANANGEPNSVLLNNVGGSISGTVYESDGTTPISEVEITVELYVKDPSGEPQWLGSTITDPDGRYSLGCLSPGTYFLKSGGIGFEQEWYADPSSVLDWTQAKAAVLVQGQEKTGVDFQLDTLAPQTFHVDIANGDDSNDGSAAHPWKTLHYAISQINTGRSGRIYTLKVALGTYSIADESDTEMKITQDNVTFIGETGSGPVLDGTGAAYWNKGFGIESSHCTFSNFYITGFSDYGEMGIEFNSGSDNVVRNCTVYGNYEGIDIGSTTANNTIESCEIYQNYQGIVCYSTSVISQNTVHDNTDVGIFVWNASPEIHRNRIFNNLSGIVIIAASEEEYRSSEGSTEEGPSSSASPLIVNNEIYEETAGKVDFGIKINSGGYGAAANPEIYHNTLDRGTYEGILIENYLENSVSPIIKYNIITNFSQYGIENGGGSPVIDYNDVWNNASGNYAGCDGFIGINGISENPLYVNDAVQNYELQNNELQKSPCINAIDLDAGDTVKLDFSGYKRPKGDGFDMGAHEFTGSETDDFVLPTGTGEPEDYRIFTVPFTMTGAELLAQMEDVLGTYDQTKWRAFAYINGTYIEFNDPTFLTLSITPGIGFWIITTLTNTIPFEGHIAPDGVDYKMALEPGWHLIALPWKDTDISLGNIKVTDGINTYSITSSSNNLTQRCVWSYTGTGPDSGYEKLDLSTDTLKAGVGFFLKVVSGAQVTVIFPPKNEILTGATDVRGSTGDEEEPPPPPGGKPQDGSECPPSVDNRLENIEFLPGDICDYRFQGTFTIGPGVTIREGATVTIRPE